ncbi:hypothetical protein Taro_007722, partial [Colocasia esculenta]|nr:hypothetical protein [Colocasia esculenta]
MSTTPQAHRTPSRPENTETATEPSIDHAIETNRYVTYSIANDKTKVPATDDNRGKCQEVIHKTPLNGSTQLATASTYGKAKRELLSGDPKPNGKQARGEPTESKTVSDDTTRSRPDHPRDPTRTPNSQKFRKQGSPPIGELSPTALRAILSPSMASRGRRGGVSAREDEPRRDEQAEQQAPAPRGSVLPPPPSVDYRVFMQGLVQAMQTKAHTQAVLQAQLEAQAQAPAQDHVGPPIMERFNRMTPPSFKGESDPLMAESWLRETEKIFRAIRCPDEDKVTLATYMLQERADVWWSSLLRTRFEDGAVDVAWDAFVRLFRAKFVPEHIQDKMEQEFLSLTQGSMTVLEYEARFSELSKYAPHIIRDERMKTKKFVMRLKPSLRTRLVAFDHRTLDEALSAACRQEEEMEKYLEEKK